MTFNVHFQTRQFGWQGERIHGLPAGWQVERLSWRQPGGPHQAELSLSGVPPETANNLADLLRRPVTVYDEHGLPLWWGFVQSAALSGPQPWRATLDELANRLAVRFERDVPGREWQPEPGQTAWAEDAFSQAEWGLRSRRVQTGRASDAQAAALCAALLEQYRLPAEGPYASAHSGGEPRLALECRGWWQTLEWNYYSQAQGQCGHVLAGDALQALGNASASARLAQSFSVSGGAWPADEVWLRCCQWHAPGDNLRVELRNNVGTAPGAQVYASGERPAAQLPGGPRWVRFALTPACTLQPGVTYWLVVQRSGAVSSAACYKVQVDEGLGYAAGVLRLGGSSWTARNPDADLNFRICGSRPSGEQLVEMLSDAGGAQFLRGVYLAGSGGLPAPLYRNGGQTCAAEAAALLRAGWSDGRRLLASVTPERVAWIEPAERPEEARLWLLPDGRIAGAQLYAAPAGRWARPTGGGPPHFLDAVEYRPASGLRAV